VRAQLDSTLGLALGLWASAPIASSLYALILLRVSQLSLYYFSRVLFVCVDLLNRHTARLAGSSFSRFRLQSSPRPGPAVRCRCGRGRGRGVPAARAAAPPGTRNGGRGRRRNCRIDERESEAAGAQQWRARRRKREIEHPTRRAPHPIS